MARRKGNTLSGRAIANMRLRETVECDCGSQKPATITETINGKVKGYCITCMPRTKR